MLDLFDQPIIPGFASRPDLIDEGEERALIAAIDRTDLSPFPFQGWNGKRLTTSFGFNYDFETQKVARAAPIPDWLLPIGERVAAFGGIQPGHLVQALLIRYDPGAGIGWHRDRPIYEHVLGLSLGARAHMRFRRRRAGGGFDRLSAPLPLRAAYQHSGQARHDWEHSTSEMDLPRWSITFRSASPRGRVALGLF